MNRQWIITPADERAAEAAGRWNVPRLIAQLMMNRGVSPSGSGDDFLAPQLRDLYPPEQLPGTREAAKLIVEHVRRRRPMVIYGDYDVDGTTGVSILWHMLKLVGADVATYVPHRIEEGYGLNSEAVSRLVDNGAELVISVDCGVTAIEVADLMRRRGVPLVVTDHHAPRERLPEAEVIVHPALDGTYGNPHLSGAGVAFKVAWGVAQQMSGGDRVAGPFREMLMQLLPLAALGTIADVVPLTGENRIIAKHGLSTIRDTRIAGLRSLMNCAGLGRETVNCFDVGFKLAPRVNAAGRMGHARLAVELFTEADARRGEEICRELDEHNRARQGVERRIVAEATEMIEGQRWASDARRAIVAASDRWHPGVVGIAAARVLERFHRPTVLIALNGEEGQGSARSITHFDLSKALVDCREHLTSFGGHAMAAGVRLRSDRIDAFREAFVDQANRTLTGADLASKLRIDAEVSLGDLGLPVTEQILALGPFGIGNPRPRLATGWVELAAEPRCVGEKRDHLQASLRENGLCMRAIGFGLGPMIDELRRHRRCRAAFEPMVNDFNGRRSAEMRLVDLRFPTA